MNTVTFFIAIILVIGLAIISLRINWSEQLSDLINLLKRKEGSK